MKTLLRADEIWKRFKVGNLIPIPIPKIKDDEVQEYVMARITSVNKSDELIVLEIFTKK